MDISSQRWYQVFLNNADFVTRTCSNATQYSGVHASCTLKLSELQLGSGHLIFMVGGGRRFGKKKFASDILSKKKFVSDRYLIKNLAYYGDFWKKSLLLRNARKKFASCVIFCPPPPKKKLNGRSLTCMWQVNAIMFSWSIGIISKAWNTKYN